MPPWPLLLALGCARGEGPAEAPGPASPAAPDAAQADALPSQPPLPTVPLTLGGTTVQAELADDEEERAMGLMGRHSLGPDQGMLFVYPDEAPRSFWMKNTPLPLSIAFLDAQGRIVRIADMAPLDLSPVPSRRPAMYALEMERGWFAAHGVFEGDKVLGLPTP
jgi:uncharacterized protein